jgi:hypothetical protein
MRRKRLKSSENPRKILRYIVEKGPKTLYEVTHTQDINFKNKLSSANLALKNLKKRGLIRVDEDESERRSHPSAKVYALTFKGLIEYLSEYQIKYPETFLQREEKESEVTKQKFFEHLREEAVRFNDEAKTLRNSLKANGADLQYPLFQYLDILSQKIHPRILYEVIITISKLKKRKRKEEEFLEFAKKYGKYRYINDGHGRKGIDATEESGKVVSAWEESLEHLYNTEEEYYRKSFFWKFLEHLRFLEVTYPNQQLYDYTMSLQDNDNKRHDQQNLIYEKWKKSFFPSQGEKN